MGGSEGRYRILIVDDDPFVGNLVAEFFSDHGYHAQWTDAASEALMLVDTACPDLIILDLIMPGMNGFEVLMRIKRKTPCPTVVVVSAFGDPETMNRAVTLGADRFLAKPTKLSDLLGEVQSLLVCASRNCPLSETDDRNLENETEGTTG